VIGFPPGGGIDILARLMAPKMSERLGQPVVVENRPGANGLIATQGALQAEADGHTILFGTTGNLAVNPVLYAGKPGMDMDREFAPLSHVASLGFVLVVNPSIPAKSLKELIDLAKAKPGDLLFGSSGNGGLPHLSGELLNLQAGIKTRHVPYRGSAPAFTDLISGQVNFVFDALAIAQPHIEAGRLRAVATTGAKRMSALPTVPAPKETLPNFEVVNWYGMVVRAGTPAAIISRLQQEVSNALRQPDVAERAKTLGLDLIGSTSEEFAKFQRAETAKWREVIRTAGIKSE
jgi:tripartite-type tricarboxylate transporter receptor subunit TctC